MRGIIIPLMNKVLIFPEAPPDAAAYRSSLTTALLSLPVFLSSNSKSPAFLSFLFRSFSNTGLKLMQAFPCIEFRACHQKLSRSAMQLLAPLLNMSAFSLPLLYLPPPGSRQDFQLAYPIIFSQTLIKLSSSSLLTLFLISFINETKKPKEGP